MKITGILLANVTRNSKLPPPTESGPAIGPVGHDIIVILVAVATVGIIAMAWAIYFHRGRRHHHRAKIITPASDPLGTLSGSNRSKRKRKRKEKFKSNPTLADTGGLPRPKNSASPSP